MYADLKIHTVDFWYKNRDWTEKG